MFIGKSRHKQYPIKLESLEQLRAANDTQLFDLRHGKYEPKYKFCIVAPTLSYLEGMLLDLGYKKHVIGIPLEHEATHAAAALAVKASRIVFPMEFDESY